MKKLLITNGPRAGETKNVITQGAYADIRLPNLDPEAGTVWVVYDKDPVYRGRINVIHLRELQKTYDPDGRIPVKEIHRERYEGVL